MKAVCPICKKKIDWKGNPNRPFCSQRCKLIDLGRWAAGDYRIPAQSEEDEEKEAAEGEEGGSTEAEGEEGNGKPSA